MRIETLDHARDVSGAATLLGLPTGRPVLVLVGGADGLDPAVEDSVRAVFRTVVLPTVRATGAVIVDGGTDSGIMRLIGDAAGAAGWPGPLVGVAVAALVTAPPGAPAAPAALEPHHTHVLLVPGTRWGDESARLADVAGVLAAGAPTVTLVVNGGDIGRLDVVHSHAAGRPVLVLRDSGRLADELAHGPAERDVGVLDPAAPLDDQRALLSAALTGSSG